MLLAEINGKRCLPVESNEDFLTSAVFGHLRLVRDVDFWNNLFKRAISVGLVPISLFAEAKLGGVNFSSQPDVKVHFWPSYIRYGEPDLLILFSYSSGRSLLLIIEVKLNSAKSSSGCNDQLSRYYDLLQDRTALGDLLDDDPLTALIYLTERYSAEEVRESIACSAQPLASSRMFALQWQDVLEACLDMKADRDSVIGETGRFLQGRNLERFRGFAKLVLDSEAISGSFYRSEYFHQNLSVNEAINGAFYHE